MKKLISAAVVMTSLLLACSSRHATKTTAMGSTGAGAGTVTTTTNPATGTVTTTSSHAAFAVPSNIQTAFTTQYPGATGATWAPYDETVVPVDWDVTDWTTLSPKDYAVTYTMDGNKYYSWYDASGNWIGTSYEITDYNNGLPAAVNQAISSNFNGYSIDKANKITWKDQTGYDLKLKNGEDKKKVLIDANGNIIKQKDK